MRRLRAIVVLLAAGCPLGPAAAQPESLVADISRYEVAITTGFAGTEMLLFGAVDGEGDVVVIVRGLSRPVVVHRNDMIVL